MVWKLQFASSSLSPFSKSKFRCFSLVFFCQYLVSICFSSPKSQIVVFSKSHLSRLYREQDGSSEPQCPANVSSQLGFVLRAGFYISPSFPILFPPFLSQTCVSPMTQRGFLTNSTLIRWNRSIVQIFHFLRLKSRMLTSPSLTLISIWTLRSRVFWLVWTVQMISLFIVLQMPEFVKIFPNYSTAKTAPAGGWMRWTVHCQINCATIVHISLLRKLMNNCRKACL